MFTVSAQSPSLIAFVLIFFGGIATSLSPCVLPVLPLVIGYMGGQGETDRKRILALVLALVAGLTVTFVVFGLASSFLGMIFGRTGRIWYFFVGLILIAMGAHLAALVKIKIPGVGIKLPKFSGFLGAFILGIFFGLVTSSCGTPILIGVLSYVSLCKSYFVGTVAMILYGIGRGVILILIGTFAGLARNVKALEPYGETINKLSGCVLILTGIYFFYQAL